jgi:hypothetical protein
MINFIPPNINGWWLTYINRLIYNNRFLFHALPFKFSYERKGYFDDFYLKHIENKKYVNVPLKNGSLENYQLYLRPDGVFSWYVFYAVIASFSCLIPKLGYHGLDYSLTNLFDDIKGLYVYISYSFNLIAEGDYNGYVDISSVLLDKNKNKLFDFVFTALVPVFYFYFSYFFVFKVIFSRPVLTDCWLSSGGEDNIIKAWFKQIPQKIVFSRKDRGLASVFFDDDIFVGDASFIKNKRVFKFPKYRQPLYRMSNTETPQRSLMYLAMLDYFDDLSSGRILGFSKVYFLLLSPAIVSYIFIFYHLVLDLLFWGGSLDKGYALYSYSALFPIVVWGVVSALYFKWVFDFFGERSGHELSKMNKNNAYIPPYIRGKGILEKAFSNDGSIDFYRRFDSEKLKIFLKIIFLASFSIVVALVVAIHNTYSAM